MIDETSIYLMIWTMIGIIPFIIYKIEICKFNSPKDFWKSKVNTAFTGLYGFICLMLWNLILIIALPAGIIWRVITWMMKSLKK